MPLTQAALTAATRVEVNDPSSLTWSDAELQAAGLAAVAEYSKARPLQVIEEGTTTTVARRVDIGDLALAYAPDAIRFADFAEYPVDEYPPQYVRLSRYGDVLTIHADGELAAATVRYLYTTDHVLVALSWPSIPAAAVEQLASGAAGFALRAQASDDSTALTLQPDSARKLRDLADEKLADFRNWLRTRAVTQAALFRPDDVSRPRDVVAWPE